MSPQTGGLIRPPRLVVPIGSRTLPPSVTEISKGQDSVKDVETGLHRRGVWVRLSSVLSVLQSLREERVIVERTRSDLRPLFLNPDSVET